MTKEILPEARELLARAFQERGWPYLAADMRKGVSKQFDVSLWVITDLIKERGQKA
jgi:uncharacterized protein (UPF0128 family)